MKLRDLPIQRKLMLIILLTSVVVMLLMRGTFFAYEFMTFRQATFRQLSTLGEIIAANSTAALAFENKDDATEILTAVQAERHIVAAALYGPDGRIFARYPATAVAGDIPAAPGPDGYRFGGSYLAGFQPVVQKDHRLGTLFLKFDTGVVLREWVWGSLRIALAVMAVVLLVAYFLSRVLQKQISQPILALADTARAISERHDYSVRAVKQSNDEVGLLTGALNQMLGEVQALNQHLERRVAERTAQLETANSDLRRSRTELKSLFESIDEGYCIIEMLFDERDRPVDYRFLTINPAFEKQTGLAGAQGRRMRELAPAHEAHWFEAYGRVALGGEPMRFQNYAEQLQRWFDVYAFRYGDPRNRQVAILFTNITDRKRHEEEIRRLNADLQERARQLENANKELEAFSYSVSHDLRAPLRHIDGFAGLLVKSDGAAVSARGRGYLTHISDSAKQMGTLIDDLLVFSRMARSEMAVGPVDLQRLAAETIQFLQTEAPQRHIQWRQDPLPVVQGDRPMLRQVFVNLLANAVKYTRPRDPAEIEIGCSNGSGHELVVHVRDNGVGFDMEYADKLFGVFQRLHRAEDFEGTGIGLANVRRIIARHGGRAWAEGKPDAGATFYFSLPQQTNTHHEKPETHPAGRG